MSPLFFYCTVTLVTLSHPTQTRRASSAEGEISVVQQKLQDAQKLVKDLSWQITMAVGGTPGVAPRSAAGGVSLPGGGAAGRMFDIMGCGANYVRK